jgi:thiol-disulfide isomerase/thioredoxin
LEPLVLSFRLLTSAVLGFALLAGGCDRQSGQKAQPQASANAGSGELAGTIDRSHKGSPLPDVTLKDPAGHELRLPGLKGKPALVNLWATWCAPCIAELPTLNGLANRADLNLAVITVSQDMGDPAKVRTFLDQHGFAQLPAWLDPRNDLAFQYQAQTLPTTIAYDAQGREMWRFTGGRDWSSAESAALLAETGN